MHTLFIIEPQDLTTPKMEVHLDQFFELHRDCFPEDNEREERSEIEKRIRNSHATPHTHLLIALDQGKVVGGAILEFYPKSACVLLTYIFTDIAKQRRGYGRFLLEDEKWGIPALLREIEKKYSPIKAFFFESENPFHRDTPTASKPIHYSDRLQFFYNFGAKRINFPYIQPPLDKGKGFANNLYLCLFPKYSGHRFFLQTKVLFAFLSELYFYLRESYPSDRFEDKKYKESDFAHDLQVATNGAASPKKFPFKIPELRDFQRAIFEGQDSSSNEYFEGCLYLHELPRAEQPKLKFGRAAVAFELAVDESYFKMQHFASGAVLEQKEFEKINSIYCLATHSFETDLFAYAHQLQPPYFTRCFMPLNAEIYMQDVILRLPNVHEFVSEGRRETFYKLSKNGAGEMGTSKDGFYEVRVKVYLNFSYFYKRSKIRVWHLVVTSQRGDDFSELDIIKLTKFFSGSQENESEAKKLEQANRIQFQIGKEPPMHLYQFFEYLAQIKYAAKSDSAVEAAALGEVILETDGGRRTVPGLKSLRTGVVQIDTGFCMYVGKSKEEVKPEEFQTVLHELYSRLAEANAGDKVTGADIEQEYRENTQAEYVFEAYCGITLGIFDFDRMTFEEVGDTLLPRSATESSFLTINRGVLTSFGYDDSTLKSSWDSIGIDPYLLIPSAVLAQNELVSMDALQRVNTKLDELENDVNGKKKTIRIGELEKLRREVLDLLNDDLLPNVFQYPTEKDLYEYGMKHRGIYERIELTRSKLQEITNFIEEGNAFLSQLFQFQIGVAGFLLAVIQSYSLITESSDFVKWLIFPIWVLFLIFVVVRWYRKLGLNAYARYIR